MVFSLAGAAALAGFTPAQQPVMRPAPITYDVKVQPWPTRPKTPSVTTPAPFMPPPDAGFMAPAPPMPQMPPVQPTSPPIDVSKPASSTRTLYYRKDSNAPVRKSAAAELTRPVAAAEPQPMQPMQPMAEPGTRPGSEAIGTTKTEPLIPAAEKLFRLEGEKGFEQYINEERKIENARRAALPKDSKEDRKALEDLAFPEHRPVPGGEGPFPGRFFAQRVECIEPNFVLYRRLLFEDINAERYGWTLGPLQPLASTYQFYNWVQWTPYRYFQFPCLRHDTGAGQCLPGDPVPSMIYPPGFSVAGALAQAGTTVAMYFIIP